MYDSFDSRSFGNKYLQLSQCQDRRSELNVLDECLKMVEPLINGMTRRFNLAGDLKAEGEQEARLRVWRLLERGALKVGQSHNFRSFLSCAIRWAFRDAIRGQLRPQKFGPSPLGLRPSFLSGNLETQADVEGRMFLDQLRKIVCERAIRRFRFRGSKFQACEFIAESFCSGDNPDVREIGEKFNLDNPEFFKGYVRVLLRIELYLHKELYGDLEAAKWIGQIYAVD